MGENPKVYGPYSTRDGRKIILLYYPPFGKAGKRKTVSYARWIMEQHLGRALRTEETVDHINEDRTDDRIENLQILTRIENNQKSIYFRYGDPYETFICFECGKEGKQKKHDIQHNRKKGKKGPFCSRQCAGRFSVRNANPCYCSNCLINKQERKEKKNYIRGPYKTKNVGVAQRQEAIHLK